MKSSAIVGSARVPLSVISCSQSCLPKETFKTFNLAVLQDTNFQFGTSWNLESEGWFQDASLKTTISHVPRRVSIPFSKPWLKTWPPGGYIIGTYWNHLQYRTFHRAIGDESISSSQLAEASASASLVFLRPNPGWIPRHICDYSGGPAPPGKNGVPNGAGHGM